MERQPIPAEQSMPTPSTPAEPQVQEQPATQPPPQEPIAQSPQPMNLGRQIAMQSGLIKPEFRSKYGAVNDYFAEEQKTEEAASSEPVVESQQEDEIPRNERGLPYGNKTERARLGMEFNDDLKSYTGHLIDSNPEIFQNDDNVSGENWDPEYVMEKVGYSDQDIANHRRAWYERKGYADTDGIETGQYSEEAANPRTEEDHQKFLIEQGADARRLYGPDQFLNTDEEELAEYIRFWGGYEKGTAQALAARANSKFHADVLMAADNERTARLYSGAPYVEEQGLVSDDMGRYSTSLLDVFTDAAAQTIVSTPEALGSVGVWMLIGGSTVLGGDPSDKKMWLDYLSDTASHAHQRYVGSELLRDAYIRTNRVPFDGDSGFLTDVAIDATHMAGMLSVDIGTSLLTGKLPGVTSLLTSIGRSPKTAVTAIARSASGINATISEAIGGASRTTARAQVGRAAAQAGAAQVDDAIRILGSQAPAATRAFKATAGQVTRIAASELKHGPNTFLMRVFGESFAASMDRQRDRAVSHGRELNATDVFFASADASANTAIAHLIGRNIPFRGKIPSSGAGSKGIYSLFGGKGFTPKTISAAVQRSFARSLLGVNRAGVDMVAFNMLTDMYMLTDREDRADVFDRYINNTGDQFKHLFGQYLVGVAIGTPRLPGNAIEPFRRLREYKSGREAYDYYNSLPSDVRRAVLDQVSDSHIEGMRDRAAAEKRFVNQGNSPLADFDRELLASIVFYGDRELPDAVLANMDGVGGEVRARFTERGDRVRTEDRAILLNDRGEVEITRYMAMMELQRRGEASDVVQFMDGSIDTIFANRSELRARRQLLADRLGKRLRPESPKPGQVTAVRGFADSVGLMSKNPRYMTPVEMLPLLSQSERLKVVRTAALHALVVNTENMDAEAVQRTKNLINSIKRVGPSRISDPIIRPFLREALRQHGLDAKLRDRVDLDPKMRQVSTIVDNLIRSNPRLTRWVISQVQSGQNTMSNPAISRRQMERLAGGRIDASQNTRRARYELAKVIEAEAHGRTNPYNMARSVRLRTTRPEGDIKTREEGMREFAERGAVPLSDAKNLSQIGRASDAPIVISEEEFKQRQEEARNRGSKPLELGRPRSVVEAEKTAGTKDRKPIDDALDRLTTDDPLLYKLREPSQLLDSDGNPMFGIPLRDRTRLALQNLRDNFGVTDVELDFGEGVQSGLADSVFALGRSHGLSVIIASGNREVLPETMDLGNGIVVISSSVPVQLARANVALRGANLRWHAELPQEATPLSWLYTAARRNFGLKRLQSIWEARTGQKFDREQFLDALSMSAEDKPSSAAIFEDIFRFLHPSQRSQLIAARPREFADLYAKQLAALEAAGFDPPSAKTGLLGTKKNTDLVLAVATGEIPYTNSKGSVRASIIRAINDGVDRRNSSFATAQDVVTEIRANREALIKVIKEQTEPREAEPVDKPTPEEHHADMSRRIADMVNDVEPVVLYDGKEIDLDKTKMIEAAYPGVISAAVRNIRKKITPKQSDPVTFEHNGYMVEVFPATYKNGRATIGSILIEEKDLVSEGGRNAELLMTESERETTDKARELLAKGDRRGTIPASELVEPAPKAESTKPPKPPKPPATEEAAGEEPTPTPGDTLKVIEPEEPAGRRGIVPFLLRTVGRAMMDPHSLSSLLGDKNMEQIIRNAYEIEQRIENKKQEQSDRVRGILKTLEKDKSSSLVNGKNGSELVKVLEAEIEPTREALDRHALTKNLSDKEKDFVIELKNIFEEHRQDHIETLRGAVRVGYNAQSNAMKIAERANEFDASLKVKVVKEPGSAKKMFEFNDGTDRVRLDRKAFINYMVNKQVPETYGYKFSYFPHMFFGSYRAKIVRRDAAGQQVGEEISIGLGEAGKNREVERLEILDLVNKRMEEERLANPELSFDVVVTSGQSRVAQEAIYMPPHLRRRLVNALKSETGAYASEINDAFNGKIRSKPVQTAFLASMLKREGAENYSTDVLRVMELAIASHYRNRLSRELQTMSDPIVREMQSGKSESWVTDYVLNLMDHMVFGQRNRVTAEQLGSGFAGGVSKTLSALRTIQFYRQLARPAQHIINSTQALQVYPLLGEIGFARAIKFYNSAEGKKYLKEYGFFDTNGRFDPGKFGDVVGNRSLTLMTNTHRALNKVTGKYWDANSEARNQNFAFVALAQHAMRNLNKTPEEAAIYGRLWGSLFTQYRFSRANDPLLLRGDFARTAGQFKRFFIQSSGMGLVLAKHAAQGNVIEGIPRYGPITRFMLLNTILGGARGSLIGASAILAGSAGLGVYKAVASAFDDEHLPSLPLNPFQSEAAAFEFLKRHAGESAAEYVMFGAFNAVGLDASGNFNLLNFGNGGLMQWLAGPTIGMFQRLYTDSIDLADAQARPWSTRAIESMIESGQATRALKSLIELLYYWDEFDKMEPEKLDTFMGILSPQQFRSGVGEMVRYRSHWDQIASVIGFQSTAKTSEYLSNAYVIMWREQWDAARKKIAGVFTRDPQKALAMMADWNNSYGAVMPMVASDIDSQIETAVERQTQSRTLRNLMNRISSEVESGVRRSRGQ